ncbi:hypothetical protein [Flammeovirga kamogawensis]|uniref:Uncharacterized protein n=1 Tax=Flammeovirga kamogawensis TaxID=373891 RepID=A0ABX8GTX6_9BACT|nr:hypothetical protein [Flammeovirga kamogawensis]MBB6459897.1 hypothetical protein [Flammeovirga kamogawensis]QWG07050.1 hypothetical protein KM029_17370 [Flammeovirga kamogawensis]TRX68872.1 hypothetical protein EO216_12360 [Flammeovirga kamogawensis]
MTSTLRHNHLIVWIALLFLIPIGIYLTSNTTVSYLSAITIKKPLEHPVTFTMDNGQLHVHVIEAYKAPSALLYIINSNNQEVFLGDISSRNKYQFSLPQNAKAILVLNGVNKSTLFESKL